MTPLPGLRERKKQRTRDAIVRSAMALFNERGYDATTIADIAEAADIAPRTFFAYFPSKEAVVFHEFDDVHERFAARLRERPTSETVFDALRAWVADWLATGDALMDTDRSRRHLVDSTPALQACDRANLAQFEELIAEGVAADLGEPVDSLRTRLVSAAAVAALHALRDYDEGGDPDPDRALAVIDEAVAFLQGGLDALRRRPAD